MLPAPQEIQLLLIIKKDLVISVGREFRTSAVFHHRDVKMWELGSSGHWEELWLCGKYTAAGKIQNSPRV